MGPDPDPAFQVIPDPYPELSTFFLFFRTIFDHLYPDCESGYGSRDPIESESGFGSTTLVLFHKKKDYCRKEKAGHTRQYVGPFTTCLSMVDLGRKQYQAESNRNDACARRQDIMKGILRFVLPIFLSETLAYHATPSTIKKLQISCYTTELQRLAEHKGTNQ